MAGATLEDVLKNLRGTETWVTADGRVLRICEMADSHLVNTIRFLERRADLLKFLTEVHFLLMLPPPGLLSDAAEECFDQEMRWLQAEESLAWLSRQPLYRAMRAEAERRGLLK